MSELNFWEDPEEPENGDEKNQERITDDSPSSSLPGSAKDPSAEAEQPQINSQSSNTHPDPSRSASIPLYIQELVKHPSRPAKTSLEGRILEEITKAKHFGLTNPELCTILEQKGQALSMKQVANALNRLKTRKNLIDHKGYRNGQPIWKLIGEISHAS
jgi:hypothetical protein